MTAVELATKTCRLCGADKPLSEYHRHRSSKDGRQSRCKTCGSETDRERRARGYKAPTRQRSELPPAVLARQKLNDRARQLAIARLIDAHRDEFERQLDLARGEVGLPVNRWEREP